MDLLSDCETSNFAKDRFQLYLAEALVEEQEGGGVVQHLAAEPGVGHQHRAVVGDPRDRHPLELLQPQLGGQDQHVGGVVEVDLVPEHLEAFLQQGWKLELDCSRDGVHKLLGSDLNLNNNSRILTQTHIGIHYLSGVDILYDVIHDPKLDIIEADDIAASLQQLEEEQT